MMKNDMNKLQNTEIQNLDGEIWKDIPDYEGYYQVSNFSRVKSLNRYINLNNIIKKIKERILKQFVYKSKNSYTSVIFSKNGIHKRYSVHRLVAFAFIENFKNKPHINHKNSVKYDNRVENLEWCTPLENMKHAYDNNLVNIPRGENRPNAKLTNKKVVEIRKLYATGVFFEKDIAKMFNCSRYAINSILNYKTWNHVK